MARRLSWKRVLAANILAVSAGVVGASILSRFTGTGESQSPQVVPGRPAPASAPANLVDISTHDELAALEGRHPGMALLEFHASWCQPCLELAPRVEALARAHPELLVVRIDASSGTAPLATEYGAETLPLLVKIRAGKEVDRRIGAPSAGDLDRWAVATGSTETASP